MRLFYKQLLLGELVTPEVLQVVSEPSGDHRRVDCVHQLPHSSSPEVLQNLSNSSHPIKQIIPDIRILPCFNLTHLIFCRFSPILLRQPFLRHLLCISRLPVCRNALTTFIFTSSLRSLTSSIAYLIPSQRNEIHSKTRHKKRKGKSDGLQEKRGCGL